MRVFFSIVAVLVIVTIFSLAVRPDYVFAADVLVTGTPNATDANMLASAGPNAVWINENTGYFFFKSSGGGLEVASTTDGGATWNVRSSLVDTTNTTDLVAHSVWWDGWTPPGTTTEFIHIVTTDTGVDDTYYTRLNVNSGTSSVTALGTTQAATCATASSCFPAITKATNNVLYMTASDDSDSWVVSCSTTCTTAGNWSERAGAYYGGNVIRHPILAPIPGTNNVLLVWQDTVLDDILYNIYSATSSGWFYTGAASGTLDTATPDNTTFDISHLSLGFASSSSEVAIGVVDNIATLGPSSDGNDTFAMYRFSSSTGWTASSTWVASSSAGLTGIKLSYDPVDQVYYNVLVLRPSPSLTNNAKVFWATSTNGSSWSTLQGPLNTTTTTVDIYGLTTAISSPAKIGAWWTAALALDDTYYSLVSDLPRDSGGGGGGGETPPLDEVYILGITIPSLREDEDSMLT